MQKVLSVHTETAPSKLGFSEQEYPELNKYLSEGWSIKDSIPVQSGSQGSAYYSITFILEKDETTVS